MSLGFSACTIFFALVIPAGGQVDKRGIGLLILLEDKVFEEKRPKPALTHGFPRWCKAGSSGAPGPALVERRLLLSYREARKNWA